MSWKPKRSPSADFLGALMGMIIGFLFLPAKMNYRPTYDFRDFMDLLWIVGGGAAGALVGTIIASIDRRMVSRR
jgi:hypothetical protein